MEKDRIFLNAINKTEIFLPNEFPKLLESFGSWNHCWESMDAKSFQRTGVSWQRIEHFFAARKTIDPEKEWAIIDKENIRTIVRDDDSYPQSLALLHDPPPILYIKGAMRDDVPTIAIVGTRRNSSYGKQVTYEFAAELSNVGVSIVSGLARGIDTFAHTACVERNNQTIAVLGSGINEASVYPPENHILAQRIVDTGGAIVSEFAPGAEPFAHHFPQRNRIIAGLSLAAIVVEAPRESGALITAHFALEQGKDVFAVPGPINVLNSEGTNYLIKQGAHPIMCVEDILEILKFQMPNAKFQTNYKSQNQNIKNLTGEEQKILEALSREPLHIDRIGERLELPITKVNYLLTLLEIKDAIRHMGNNIYAKIKN